MNIKVIFMQKIIFPLVFITFLFGGCIGDDIIYDTVPESLRIINPLDTLAVGDTYTFNLLFTNNVGLEESREASWSSSDPGVLLIDNLGVATGMSKGQATVTATVELADQSPLSVSRLIVVDEETVEQEPGDDTRQGTIRTTSNYVLKGSFQLQKNGTNLLVEIFEDYEATSALPGLYVYLTNNPNTTQGALEIGAVDVFKGAHSYTIGGDIPLNQYTYLLYYCKPFNVKVGDGEIGE